LYKNLGDLEGLQLGDCFVLTLVPQLSTVGDPERPWTAKTHSGAEKMRLLEPTA